jgi:hypothetical protein
MINDSVPWREELWRVADRLEKKSRQERWTDRSTFLVERDMMVSAYAIRRLMEAHKLTDALTRTRIPVMRHKRTGEVAPDVWSTYRFWDFYDLDSGTQDHISIRHWCNQLIHSFVWRLSCTEDTELFDGAYVASENEKEKHVYFIPVVTVIDLCRRVASEETGSIEWRRDSDGVMHVVSVKVMEDEPSIEMKSPEATRPYA